MNELLANWFSNCVAYLHRVIELIKSNIAVLIERALSCSLIELENLSELNRKDINLFLKAFECSKFVNSPISETSTVDLENFLDNQNKSDNTLKIQVTSDSEIIISHKGINSLKVRTNFIQD